VNKSFGDLLYGVVEKIIGYLPSLAGGLVLLAIAWILGWVAKRVVVRMCLVLRVDRMFLRTRSGAGLAKADARYVLFDNIGNAVFIVVFLVLMNAALSAMKLTVLSDLLQSAVLFIPKLLIALLIFGVGFAVSGRVSVAVYRGLASEEVPKSMLIARLVKSVIILFFSAMALTEIGIAREIVIIGFSTVIGTICAIAVILVAIGGRGLIKRIVEKKEDEDA
jgi:hypothetical protein